MRNALQDQLLKAGLVKPTQLDKAKRDHRQARRGNPPNPPADQARLAEQQNKERDRKRNQELAARQERKARIAQIRELVGTRRLDRGGGESTFQFVEAGKVRKIYLHEAQRAQLIAGTLAVVRVGQMYELVPLDTADKIAARDAACVVVRNDLPAPAPESAQPDPYADFPVPDDLIW